MWACLLRRWESTLLAFAGIFVAAGVVFGIALVIAVLLGGEITFAAVFGFFLVMLAFLIILLIWDLIVCLTSPTPPPPSGSGSGSGMLTSAVDCATAQQMLAEATARATQLQAQINLQTARVATAQQRLNTARMAMSAAAAVLAASIFAPWAIPAAVAGLAAATYLAFQAAKNLEAELTTLERLATQFGQAQRDVAFAQGLISQACTPPVTPPVVPVGGIELPTGALHTIARGHGRRAPSGGGAATTSPA